MKKFIVIVLLFIFSISTFANIDLKKYISDHVGADLLSKIESSKDIPIHYEIKEKQLRHDLFVLSTKYFKDEDELKNLLPETYAFYSVHEETPKAGHYLAGKLAFTLNLDLENIRKMLPPEVPFVELFPKLALNQKVYDFKEANGTYKVNFQTETKVLKNGENDYFNFEGYYSSFYRTNDESGEFKYDGILGLETNKDVKRYAILNADALHSKIESRPDGYLFLFGKNINSPFYQGHEAIIKFYSLQNGKTLITLDTLITLKENKKAKFKKLFSRRNRGLEKELESYLKDILIVYAYETIEMAKSL